MFREFLRTFQWTAIILTAISPSLFKVSSAYPADCTVDELIRDVDQKDASVANLTRNQESFHEACSSSCKEDAVNGILRLKCSDDDAKYAVYQCPNNDTIYYIADYENCRLKYYTLCNDSSSYSDPYLAYVIKDIMCGCSDNIQYDMGSNSCSFNVDLETSLYCRKYRDSYPYIAKMNTCSGYPLCMDNIDHDQDRFNCSQSGIYCEGPSSSFVASRFICDGKTTCEDSSDEHNCTKDSDSGVYCDANATAPEQYIIESEVCDKIVDCDDNWADEAADRCPENYCKSIDDSSVSIFMSNDMMCNGSTECLNAEDENITNCYDIEPANGATCDNGTKWVQLKYLCTGRNLCDDGMDSNTTRWNCHEHEICPDPDSDDSNDVVLCNSTTFCTTSVPGTISLVMKTSCAKCENGGSDDVERCRNATDKGIICNKTEYVGWTETIVETFVATSILCDSTVDCDVNGEDEINCENGYYCGEGDFVPWSGLCNGYNECSDGSDEQCDSDFFEKLRETDVDQYGNNDSKSYLNTYLLKNSSTDLTDDMFEIIVKHRIFACQEYLYNMDDPEIAAIITNTMDNYCISPTKFHCHRRYFTQFEASTTIMKGWLCDGYEDCAVESGNPSDESGTTVHSCRSSSSSACYSENMKCDDVPDCDDGSDEIGCSDMGLRCNGTIVEDAYICDGFDDCLPYGEDEKICDNNIIETLDTCSDSDDQFTLYSNLIVDQESNNYTLTEEKFSITENCKCEDMRGGRYMAAVCSTEGGQENQPCSDSQTFNNSLCYDGSWFTEMYNSSELDESCKLKTNTLTLVEMVNEAVKYKTFVQFNEGAFLDKSIHCKNPDTRKDNKCGISLDKMCDLKNDCGDWSDESDEYCKNNFMCKTGDDTTRVIPTSKLCDGTSDCGESQDECLLSCIEDFLTSTVRLLGDGWSLITIVWIFGTVSLVFNFYLIITMAKSAFDILEKMPHRFIYRILVTTIAIGDIMVSIYLVILASVDTFRSDEYCKVKEKWLTGSTCVLMGVLSTFGNHLSLFAMVTLSLFRLKTVIHYMWPRTVNKARAIRIALVLVLIMTICAAAIALIPLSDSLKDYFVDRYYFPNRRNVFNDGTKDSLYDTLILYNDTMQKYNTNNSIAFNNTQIREVTAGSSWSSLLTALESMFVNSTFTADRKPYSFYSSHGVCLFNYLNSKENNSFPYVISIITMNLICFLLIILCYMLIWKVGTKSKSTEKQLQKKLSIAVALNILCRVPLFMICLAHSIEGPHEDGDKCTGTCLYYRYMSVFVIPINSVINPFINSEVPLLEFVGLRYFTRKFKSTNTVELDNTIGITQVANTTYVAKAEMYNPHTDSVKTETL